MKHGHGSCIVGHVVRGSPEENVSLHAKQYHAYYQVNTRPVTYRDGCFGRGEERQRPRTENNAFVPMDEIVSDPFYSGALAMMQLSGIGALRPNVVQLGFSRYWEKSVRDGGASPEAGKKSIESKNEAEANGKKVEEYVRVIDAAIGMHYGVVITSGLKKTANWDARPEEKGEIHVWWMAPDGGLTLLLPQLMMKSSFWRRHVAQVKLFFVLPGDDTDEEVKEGILTAIERLRVKMDPVFLPLQQASGAASTATGRPDGPTKETVAAYEGLAGVAPIGSQKSGGGAWVYRWLRISELIKERSSDATFVYASMPKKPSGHGALDWYGLVHTLQSGAPPMALIRGNGINCLTMFQE
jgi:sodium/chloride transporter 3